jgi:hypothetical protein
VETAEVSTIYTIFIRGLLATLLEPETEWAAAARIKWLQTAANIFDLIYTGDGGGIVVTLARLTARRALVSTKTEAAN